MGVQPRPAAPSPANTTPVPCSELCNTTITDLAQELLLAIVVGGHQFVHVGELFRGVALHDPLQLALDLHPMGPRGAAHRGKL